MGTNILRHGSNVFACNGHKLGTIGHIFSAAPTSAAEREAPLGSPDSDSGINPVSDPENVDRIEREDVSLRPGAYTQSSPGVTGFGTNQGSGIAEFGAPDPNPDASGHDVVFSPSDTKYFEVHHGGILGIGGSCLYVPFTAVDVVEPGGSVTLKCTPEEAAAQFSDKPPMLDAGTEGS